MSSGDAHNSLPAREFLVDAETAGQRIDNFLSARLKGLPRARIYRILRRGEVRVNRGRIRQHYRLQVGDVVRVPPVRLAPPQPAARPPAQALRWLDDAMLYEHEGLLVLDKPAGVAVHGGSGISHGVIEALRAARPGARLLELVHRLDRDTSGCLMVATRRQALTGVHEALRVGRVRKEYLALLAGRWRGGARRVEAALRPWLPDHNRRFGLRYTRSPGRKRRCDFGCRRSHCRVSGIVGPLRRRRIGQQRVDLIAIMADGHALEIFRQS